jgi:L-asparaginase
LYTSNTNESSLIVRKHLDDNVVILKLFPGITEKVVKNVLEIDGLKGVVIETYGAGNAPTYPWFVALLREAIKSGIHIVNVTQCVGGSVILGHYETSVDLKNIGVIDGKDITTESAIAKLMYLLGENISKLAFKKVFESSLRGEINS